MILIIILLCIIGNGAVLKAILKMEDLHLIQFLDVILAVQSSVMERFAPTVMVLFFCISEFSPLSHQCSQVFRSTSKYVSADYI